jgi:DnaJ-class molecular chaperone
MGLGGENLQIVIPAGTQSGTALRLSGKGMPKVGGKGKGDLFVVVEVRTPTELSDRERALLLELAQQRESRPREDASNDKKPGVRER